MRPLTPRQQEILNLIRTTLRQTGMPPTRADICQHFRFRSITAADDHLKALEKKGAITLLSGKSRGILLAEDDVSSDLGGGLGRSIGQDAGLPVVGRVAAGEPILAEQNVEDHYHIDAKRFRPRADYLLKVCGHSMRDAGILDGDLLAVHRTQEAYNGQIVVARVEDDVTVKRFRQKGNVVTLLPENKNFDPIHVHLGKTEFAIEGLGVGVIRDQGL